MNADETNIKRNRWQKRRLNTDRFEVPGMDGVYLDESFFKLEIPKCEQNVLENTNSKWKIDMLNVMKNKNVSLTRRNMANEMLTHNQSTNVSEISSRFRHLLRREKQ